MAEKKFDVMAAVTDRIIEALEKGTAPWTKPWTGADLCVKHRNGKPYSLLNQLLLGDSGEYLSYKEAIDEGGHVKKGAKGNMVVFWKVYDNLDKDELGNVVTAEDGKIKTHKVFILRYYTVFHINDCEGIEPKWTNKSFDTVPIERVDATLMDYVNRGKVALEIENSDKAYYSPKRHLIHIPEISQFEDVSRYYDTAFHEAVHSTGHHTLLNRFPEDAMAAAFGSDSYSKEELVAEIGACTLLNKLGIETEQSFRNSAAYIDGWLRALKKDKNLIVSAASKAQKAVALILNEQDDEEAA